MNVNWMGIVLVAAALFVEGSIGVDSRPTAAKTPDRFAQFEAVARIIKDADLQLIGDERDATIQPTSIRFVGDAKTGSGVRSIYCITLGGTTAQSASLVVRRVLYFDNQMKLDFVHSIGCGSDKVLLSLEKENVIVISGREYDLSIKQWQQPLIEQQNFCLLLPVQHFV